tara:strand:- start:280 stop:2322 length:2043 start_codon:yes stop_codon:yes gene_type:complete
MNPEELKNLSDEEINNIIYGKKPVSKSQKDSKIETENKLPKAKANTNIDISNFITSLLQTGLQSPSFGFSDEISGAMTTPYVLGKQIYRGEKPSLTKAYTEGRDAVRNQVNTFQKQNPLTSLLTQGLFSAPLLTQKATTLASQILPKSITEFSKKNPVKGSIGAGVSVGGITGIGSSEANNFKDFSKDVTESAIFGGLLGPAAYGIGTGISALSKPITSRFRTPSTVAKEILFSNISKDKDNIKNITKKMEFPEQILGLSGGVNVKNLLDLFATASGDTGNVLAKKYKEYRGGLKDRLLEPLQESLNPEKLNFDEVIKQKIVNRKKIADPLYQKFKSYTFDVNENAGLEDVLTRAQPFFKEAKELAALRGQEFSLSPENAAFDLVKAGDLDYVKRSLDSQIESAFNQGKKTKASALIDLRKDLINITDNLTTKSGKQSDYKNARSAWAKESAFIDQAEKGRIYFAKPSIDSTDTKLYFDSLTDVEQEAFRFGAYETIRRKLGSRSGKTGILNARSAETGGEEETAEKLKLIFKNDKDWKKFVNRAEFEYSQKDLGRLGQGSPTAKRDAGFQETAEYAEDLMRAASMATYGAKTGDPFALTGVIPMIKSSATKLGTPVNVRDQVGKYLTATKNELGPLGLLNIEEDVIKNLDQNTLNRILRSNRLNLLQDPSNEIGFGLLD